MNKNNTNAVPLNTTTFNTRLLNTTKLNTNGFPVLSKRSGSSADISQAIMDSLVCWYDPGKQQCTNESMAANPVLADLSGNGHDIECFNFGWAGMSGIGGYFYDNSNLLANLNYATISGNIISIISNEGAAPGTQISSYTIRGKKGETLTYIRKAFDVKISNLPDEINFQVNVAKNNGNKIEWESIGYLFNGINHVDEKVFTIESYDLESTPSIYDFRILFSNELISVENIADLGITIEILPLYPNALVSDGVDDYCYTKGMPILTDYTVIAKRKILADKVSALASKATDNNSTDGAFIFDGKNFDGYIASNFGANNALVELYPEDVSYQTKESYNGSPIIKLNHTDTDKLSLFTFSAQNNLVSQYALYSFLLFDRTLTTAEIEWVKKNMIESGGVLKTNWADRSLYVSYVGSNKPDHRANGEVKSTRITIKDALNSAFLEILNVEDFVPSYKIKVSGLKNDIELWYKTNEGSGDYTLLSMSKDGVYTLPKVIGNNNHYVGFRFNKAFENENIVIQQLLSE